MSRPRCGNRDPVDRIDRIDRIESRFLWGNKKKYPDYLLQGSKWTSNKLTYRIKEPDASAQSYWSTKMSKEWTKRVISWAFNEWSAVTPLEFEYVDRPQQKVHFSIQFSKGIHCCHSVPDFKAKFDGKKGELAHTDYPEYGGDIHIDDDEDWKLPNDLTSGSLPSVRCESSVNSFLRHSIRSNTSA